MKIGIVIVGASFNSTWILNWTKVISEFINKSEHAVHMLTVNYFEVTEPVADAID